MSRRPLPPPTILVSQADPAATKVNFHGARLFGAARRLSRATRTHAEGYRDVDFNALSVSLQVVLGQARRRGLPDEAIAAAAGASLGALAATLEGDARVRWIDGVARVVHASAGMTDLAARNPKVRDRLGLQTGGGVRHG